MKNVYVCNLKFYNNYYSFWKIIKNYLNKGKPIQKLKPPKNYNTDCLASKIVLYHDLKYDRFLQKTLYIIHKQLKLFLLRGKENQS